MEDEGTAVEEGSGAELEASSQLESNGKVEHPNLLDELRERRAEIGSDRTMDLEVPGYDGLLVVRYRRLEWDEISKIATKTEKSKNPRRILLHQVDVLIAACEQVLIVHEGSLKPINEAFPELGDEPVRYDVPLANALGFQAGSAREVVLGLFKLELAVVGHHTDLLEFFGTSSAEADRDFPMASPTTTG